MSSIREVKEGRSSQGAEELIAYKLTTTPWGIGPSNPVVKAYDVTASNADVSGTVLSGSPSVSGDVITTPLVGPLTAGHLYRIEIKFSAAGNTLETYMFLDGET